jgi:hypothetical protein
VSDIILDSPFYVLFLAIGHSCYSVKFRHHPTNRHQEGNHIDCSASINLETEQT